MSDISLEVKQRPLFTWNKNTRRFRRTSTGRFVGKKELENLRGDYLNRERSINDNLAERLFNRDITIDEWRNEMRRNLRRVYKVQYLLGKGGLNQMTPRDWGIYGSQLKKQYGFLDNFAKEIVDGRFTIEQVKSVAARQQLYATSSNQAFERGRTETFGPLDLPAYAGDGSSICKTNDKCEWVFVIDGNIIIATWKLNPAEHCKTCLARSRKWKGLKFNAQTGKPLQPIPKIKVQ